MRSIRHTATGSGPRFAARHVATPPRSSAPRSLVLPAAIVAGGCCCRCCCPRANCRPRLETAHAWETSAPSPMRRLACAAAFALNRRGRRDATYAGITLRVLYPTIGTVLPVRRPCVAVCNPRHVCTDPAPRSSRTPQRSLATGITRAGRRIDHGRTGDRCHQVVAHGNLCGCCSRSVHAGHGPHRARGHCGASAPATSRRPRNPALQVCLRRTGPRQPVRSRSPQAVASGPSQPPVPAPVTSCCVFSGNPSEWVRAYARRWARGLRRRPPTRSRSRVSRRLGASRLRRSALQPARAERCHAAVRAWHCRRWSGACVPKALAVTHAAGAPTTPRRSGRELPV
jgi:hypothetical protein